MKKFRGIMMRFIDKTSNVQPEEKNGRKIWPKVFLPVKVANHIPPKHRLCK